MLSVVFDGDERAQRGRVYVEHLLAELPAVERDRPGILTEERVQLKPIDTFKTRLDLTELPLEPRLERHPPHLPTIQRQAADLGRTGHRQPAVRSDAKRPVVAADDFDDVNLNLATGSGDGYERGLSDNIPLPRRLAMSER